MDLMNKKNPHILVVDDEPGITELLQICFEREGFRVSTAGGGWEAIALVEAQSFDLVLTDVRMPSGDGIELLERIEELPLPRPEVAIMTSYADIQPPDLYGRGACALFEKPLEVDEVIVRLQEFTAPVTQRWQLKDDPSALPQVTARFDDFAAAERRGELRLGRGGFFVATDNSRLRPGTIVGFTLQFPERALRGQARVVWARPEARHGFHAGLGLETIGLDPETLSFVVAALSTAPQAYIPLGLKPTHAT